MKGLSYIQPAVYLLFSTVFLTIGVFMAAPLNEVLVIVAFQLSLSLAFYIPVSNNTHKLATAFTENSRLSQYDVWLVCLLVLLGPGFLAFCFFRFSVPIFATNVEAQRVFFAQSVGFMYRVSVLTLYLLAPALTICYNNSRNSLYKLLVVIIWLICIITIIFTGFRSRIIDFFLLSLLTHFLVVFGRGRSFKSFVKKNIIWLVLLSVIPLGLIVLITSLRVKNADSEMLVEMILDRIFAINYNVNIRRIYLFTEDRGFMWGSGYLNDIKSMVSDTKSMQELVSDSFNFNKDGLFVMTPTMYGEAYLNFGNFSILIAPFLILIYRLITESLLEISTYLMRNSLFLITFIINITYALPRVSATGGISNAFLSRVIPLFIALVFIRGVLLLMKLFSETKSREMLKDNRTD